MSDERPRRTDRFTYTSPDQLVFGKENIARSRALSKLRRLVNDEKLDAVKLLALVEENLDALRTDEQPDPSEGEP